jgi:hypothetical protein
LKPAKPSIAGCFEPGGQDRTRGTGRTERERGE